MVELASIRIVDTAYVDEEGYLQQPDTWNRTVAEFLAKDTVLGDLTEEHWVIIDYLRQYYLKFGIVPPVKKLCRDTGIGLNSIYKLFPPGLARGACKIAGIPRDAIKPSFLYP